MRVPTESYFRRTEMRIVTIAPCDHTHLFVKPFPTVGEELYCKTCNTAGFVKGTMTEFRVSCLSCAAGARFGRAEENAYRWAVSHRRRRPAHIVVVRDGNEVKHIFDNRGQLLLAVGDEGDPGF